MAITRYGGDRFTVDTGDTKPTGVTPGAFLIDTGNRTSWVKTGFTVDPWVQLAGGGGGGGTPGGSNTQVQFNDSNSFGGSANLTFTNGNRLNVNKLGISGNIYDSNNSIGEGGMVLTNEGTTGVNWKSIESVLSGVGGSGVANYVARWSDEDTITTGALYDDGGSVGVGTTVLGEALTVNGKVEADEFLGELRGPVVFGAKAAEALVKGEAVYISGISGNTTVVAKACANETGKMPVFGLAHETVNANTFVEVTTFGTLSNINTSSFLEGDELFVGITAGALVNSPPTGEAAQIQKIAKVTRSDATVGSVKVMGAGRSNATPNLNEGRLFVGNSSNQAVADGTIHVDIANNKVGIGTAAPEQLLEISATGDAAIQFQSTKTSLANSDPIGSIIFKNNDSSGSNPHICGKIASIAETIYGRAGLAFSTGRTSEFAERMRIRWDGNIGIGLTDPDAKLEIKGTAGSTGLTFKTTDSSSNNTFWIQDGGKAGLHYYPFVINQDNSDTDCPASTFFYVHHATAPFIIKNDGNVGIGTTNPDAKIRVSNSASSGGTFKFTDGSSRTLMDLGGGILSWNAGSVMGAGSWAGTADHQFQTLGTTRDTVLINGPASGTNHALYVTGLKSYFAGNVGIGALNPTNTLEVKGPNTVAPFKIVNSSNADRRFLQISSQSNYPRLTLYNNTEVSTIHLDTNGVSYFNGGSVGIGTNSPVARLHVHETTAGRIQLTNGTSNATTSDGLAIAAELSTRAYFWLYENAYMQFATNNAERMRITAGGSVGIGTTNPQYLFEVYGDATLNSSGATTDVTLRWEAAGATKWRIKNDTQVTGGTDHTLTFTSAGAANVSINQAGNVGINTTAPGSILQIKGDGTLFGSTITVRESTGTTDRFYGGLDANEHGYISLLGSDNTNRVYLTGSSSTSSYILNNVGIGTASPIHKLEVVDAGAVNVVSRSSGGTAALTIDRASVNDDAQLLIKTASVNKWRIATGLGGNDEKLTVYDDIANVNMMSFKTAVGVGVGPNFGTAEPIAPLHVRQIDLVDNSRNALLLLDGKFADTNIESADEVGIAFRVENSGGGAQQTTSITSSYQTGYNSLNLQPAGGNVGIGTNSPANKLTITDGATSYTTANVLLQIKRNAANGNDDTSKAAIQLGNNSNAFQIAYGGTSDRLRFLDGGAVERITLVNGGNVGIGTTAPLGKLHVQGGQVLILDSTANPSYGPRLSIGRNISEALHFDVDDYDCIITADQDSDNNGNHDFILDRSFAGTGENNFQIQKGGSSQFLINTDGNVGINNTSPEHRLHVAGDAIISGYLYDSTNSTGVDGYVLTSKEDGPQWKLVEDVLSGVGGNGTANYIPKWEDEDTIGNSVIYQNSGSVGIGTTELGVYKFRVEGGGYFSANLDFPNSFGVRFYETGGQPLEGIEINTSNQFVVNGEAGTTIPTRVLGDYIAIEPTNFMGMGVEALRVIDGGNVGIGTTTPNARLKVMTSSTDAAIFQSTHATTTNFYISNSNATANNTANLYFGPANGVNGALIQAIAIEDFSISANRTADLAFQTRKDGTMAEKMRITADGNVGIGTDAPSRKFEIFGGSARMGVANSTEGVVLGLLSDDAGYLHLNNGSGTNTIQLRGDTVSYFNAGSVGIGTTSPSETLEINHSNHEPVLIKSTGNYNSMIAMDSNRSSANSYVGGLAGKWNGTQVASIYLRTGSDTTNKDDGYITLLTASAGTIVERMRIQSDGNVGIGTTNPSTLLEVGGDADVYGLVGRAKMGTMGHADYAGFSHRDMGGTGNYCLLQGPSGSTFLNAASSRTIYFRVNNSDTMYMTSTQLQFNDNKKVILGNDGDLEIYHDGSHSYIKDTGTGSLYIQGGPSVQIENASGANMAVFTSGGAAELYHNNSKKFETLSNGAKVTGTAGYLFGGDGEILAGQDSSGYYFATGAGQDVNKPIFIGDNASYIKFKTSNAEQVRIDSNGSVGIGTTAIVNWTKLQVQGGIHSTSLINSDDYFRVRSGGVTKVIIEGNGSSYFNGGNVGINTTTPSSILQIKGDGTLFGSTITIKDSTGTTDRFYGGLDNNEHAYISLTGSDNTNRVYLTGSSSTSSYILNNVGVGTISPSTKLHVVGSETDDGVTVQSGTNVYLELDSTDAATTREVATKYKNFSTGTNFWWTGLNQSGAYDIAYGTTFTNTNTKLRIQADGNVGIGTVSPAGRLDVRGELGANGTAVVTSYFVNVTSAATSSAIYIGASSGTDWKIGKNVTGITNNTNFSISDHANNRFLDINSSGNVGIGTVSPAAKLHVYLTGSAGSFSNIGLFRAGPDSNDSGAEIFVGQQGNSRGLVIRGGRGTGDQALAHFYLNQSGGVIPSATQNHVMTFLQGGYVGIGTTNPGTYKLYVDGPTYIDDYLIADGNIHFETLGQYISFYGDNSRNHSIVANNSLGNAGDDLRINTYGALFINLDSNSNNSSGADFSIGRHGSTGTISDWLLDLSGETGKLRLYKYGLGTHTGTLAKSLGVDSSGNVIEFSGGTGTVTGSGTDNYIPRWNGTTALENSSIYDNGSVGIGTTVPGQKLHVNGSAEIDGSIYLNDTNTRIVEGGSNSVRLQTNSGYVDVGPQNTSYSHFQTDRSRFYFNKELIVDSGIIRSYDEDLVLDASFVSSTAKNIILRTGNVEKVRMDTNGNVGIGTTNPGQILHLKATLPVIKLESNNSQTRIDFYDGSTGQASIGVNDSFGDAFSIAVGGGSLTSDSKLVVKTDGKVGIGTTNPSYLLDLESTTTGLTHNLKLNKSSTTGDYAEIAFQLWSGAGTGLNTFGGSGTSRPSVVLRAVNESTSSAAGAFVVGTFTGGSTNSTLTEKFRITSAGSVGIGTTTPGSILQIKGDGTLFGSTITVKDSAGATDRFYGGLDANEHGYISLLGNDNTNRVYLTGSSSTTNYILNNLGVGGSTANQTLTITNPSTGDWDKGLGFRLGSTDTAKIIVDSAGLKFRTFVSGDDFYFRNSANTTTLIITGGGNVGIGAANPDSKLNVGGTFTATTAKPTVAVVDTSNGGSLGIRGLSPVLAFDITSSGTPKILMDGGGLEFKTGTLDGEGDVDFKIQTDGNVGIGTTNPGYKLDVSGTLRTTGQATFNAGATISNNQNLNIGTTGSNTGYVRFFNNNATAYYIDWESTGARAYRFYGSSSGSAYTTTFSQAGTGGHNVVASGNVTLNSRLTFSYNSHYFEAGTNSIVFKNGSGTAYLSVNNVGTTVTGRFNTTGRVGVYGTTIPTYSLNVYGNTANSATGTMHVNAGLNGSGKGLVITSNTRTTSDNSVAALEIINRDGTNTLTATVAGNVGIGTTAPASLLTVYENDSSAGNTQIYIHNDKNDDAAVLKLEGKRTSANDTAQVLFANSGNSIAAIKALTAGADDGLITFSTSAAGSGDTLTEYMRIQSDGKVGIGTDAPGIYKLNVQGGGYFAQMLDFPNAYGVRVSDSGNAPKRVVRIDSSNQFLLNEDAGTTIPTKILGDYIALEPTNFFGMGVEALRVIDGGNVGIGVTNPSYKLEVNGSFAATTKSFVIDHPTKPGKKLRYASLEGPENGVYVRGKGESNIIELPEYWTELVYEESITVNLVPIGSDSNNNIRAYSVQAIKDNKVYIYTDSHDNVYKYFFTIYGERKDVEKLKVEID